MKVEYPPLFTPGFHDIDVLQLEKECVSAFSSPFREHRQHLLDRFKAFLVALRATGVRGSLWVDGSFTTQKIDPSDVDLLVVIEPASVTPLNYIALQQLFDRTASKLRYKCDVLSVSDKDTNMLSYWRGWYGFARDDTPKGIVRMSI